jgi:phage replication O-like protein O
MSCPQVENGYTRIANELLEAICSKINKADYLKTLLFLIRITYGFHRKLVKSNYKSFSTNTNIAKSRMEVLLSELYLRKVISFQQLSEEYFWIGLNKNYEEWHLEEIYL